MNLRARGILFSLLPLALVLVLAVPEATSQIQANLAAERASRSVLQEAGRVTASLNSAIRIDPHLATNARLRNDVRTFGDRAQADEVDALSSLDRLWKWSLLLLGLLVAGMALTSVLLLRYSGQVVGRIAEIGAARDLRERELQRYRLLAEVTHDLILFIDRADLTIVEVNAAALAAYGYTRAELIGKPSAILHAVDDPIDADTIAQTDTPSALSYEGVHQRSDGTMFPVEVNAGTAKIDGRLTIVETIRDISERRHAAVQVALALDQALEASRLKSEFVATMSHEIRTPMHGVIGMSELLLETPLTPVQREYAGTLKESAQSLLGIIDDVLDFSKLEANRLELETVAFAPAQLVTSAVNLARAASHEKKLVLRSYTSPFVPDALRGDPTRLRQVLINLIGNAVKFTARGSITVTTSVERDDGRFVVLSFAVSDTGIGVSPEARERLFEAFVQGDGTTTRRFGGSGLGLSISRRLVELMGGRIWLGEHEGPGSTFCFTARFERTADVLAPPVIASGALRVLVLDDDEGTRQMLETMLASFRIDSASAGDIEAARMQLGEAAHNGTPFDIVLIDYVLPRSDGLAFAAEIGAHPEYGTPARILITSFDAVGRKEAAFAAGCAAYLSKPIDPSALYDAVTEIERARRLRDSTPADADRHARILLAEDNALVRRVTRFQLKELQYGVDIVENGEEAVAATGTGRYELVLMDMRMPEMDGLEATRAIRTSERENGRHVIVVALTANVLDGDREACMDAGMDDFLTKPLELKALREVLERWLPERV